MRARAREAQAEALSPCQLILLYSVIMEFFISANIHWFPVFASQQSKTLNAEMDKICCLPDGRDKRKQIDVIHYRGILDFLDRTVEPGWGWIVGSVWLQQPQFIFPSHRPLKTKPRLQEAFPLER